MTAPVDVQTHDVVKRAWRLQMGAVALDEDNLVGRAQVNDLLQDVLAELQGREIERCVDTRYLLRDGLVPPIEPPRAASTGWTETCKASRRPREVVDR